MKKFTFLSILLLLSACACFNYTRATIKQDGTVADTSSSEPSFAVTSLNPANPFTSGYTPAQLTATAQASNPPKPKPFSSGYTPAQLTATAQASNPPKPKPFSSGYTPAQLTATAQASNPPKPKPFSSGYTPAQLTATAQASNPPKSKPFSSGYTPAQLTATAQASNPPKSKPFSSGYTPAQLTATAQASNPPKSKPFSSGYTPAQLTATAQASNPPKSKPLTSGHTPAQLTATAQASNPPKSKPFSSGYTPAQLTATAQASNPPKSKPFSSGYTPAQLTATAQASNPPKSKPAPKPKPTTPPTIMQCNTTHTTNKAHTFSGVLAYTRYNIEQNGQLIHTPNNVNQVAYSYTNGKLTLSTSSNITTLAGADGIVTLPDGSLIVGGEGTIWKVNPKTGAHQPANPGGSVVSDHVTYDKQKNVIWTSGDNPLTTLSKVPVSPFGNGTPVQLKGDDTVVSAVAFDGSYNAYYTSSDIQGNGTFGVLNLTTFTTIRKISHLPAAHGIIYDPFTNTLLLAGANHITQIDPKTFKIVSDWSAPTAYPGIQLDQDTTDGLGHVLVASNDGNLVFIDFSKTRKIAASTNYVSIQHLDTNLDDMTLECLNK
jgi:hypothetical protein